MRLKHLGFCLWFSLEVRLGQGVVGILWPFFLTLGFAVPVSHSVCEYHLGLCRISACSWLVCRLVPPLADHFSSVALLLRFLNVGSFVVWGF